MTLTSGTRLGPYEILAPIGAGGMGEVYRARDTKLDRDVAIKVLPEEFAFDPERLARFEREAKLLASLNHPNIAGIHGFEESDGVNALVLELVEGPTLAERIARGPIPVDEAIAIAKQIADALEAGHEAGVIHRDLKPANIKLKEDGTVKVLDYGLAKALAGEEPTAADSELSQSPTLTRQGTQVGMILGTAAYMSPEQAKGKRVDKRTDIFALGVVIFEMLSGVKAFPGDDVSEILASVITLEPDWAALPADVPHPIHQLVRACLKKNPRERLRDVGGAFFALDAAREPPASVPARTTRWLWAGLGALAGALVLGAVVWSLLPGAVLVPRVSHLAIPLPDGQLVGRDFALSPDGRTLVYSALEDGSLKLYRRPLDDDEPVEVEGTEGGGYPFFSPDGAWVGFATPGELRKTPVAGGDPVTITESSSLFHGGTWTRGDEIVFGSMWSPLQIVSANGGDVEPLTSLAEDEFWHGEPSLIADERAVLFEARRLAESYVAIWRRGEQDHRPLLQGRRPRLTPSGHLVFARDERLWGVPFDEKRLEVVGEPTPLGYGTPYAVGSDGMLIYSNSSILYGGQALVWVARDGEHTVFAEAGQFRYPRVSPDGLSVVVNIGSDAGDLWIYDVASGRRTRLTSAGDSNHPAWAPDGGEVTFAGSREGGTEYDLLSASIAGGEVEALYRADGIQTPTDWSPDGKHLAFLQQAHGRPFEIWLLPDGGEPQRLLGSSFAEKALRFSPDGHWVVYVSNESGNDEVYVQAFPDLGRKYPISSNGGTEPVWSPSGEEIFFRRGDRMMAVSIQTEPTFLAGDPSVVFEGSYIPGGFSGNANYDVSPDGERFLMVESMGRDVATPSELFVVTNWHEELKRLVPTP